MTQSNSKKKGCGCLPLLGVIFLAGLGGGYFLFRNYLGEELTHYSGAKIIPEEAVMTSFISTNSSDWSNLNQFGTAEAKKIINNNLQELEKEIITDDDSINYQKDIQPWLGGIMVTLLPSKTEKFNYDLALILGIKNKFKAWQFIEKITKDSEVEVEKKKYKDLSFYKYQETQNNTFFLSQFKNYLVLTSNQNTLEEIIDTFKGENSLANQENFNSTLNQKVTIKKPLMQIYLPDYEQLIQNAIKHSLSSKNEQPITTKKSTEIHSIVMSMGIEDNGIHFQALADLPDYLDENKLNELNSVSNQLIKNIPENTIFMINGSGINQAWQAIEKQKKLIPDLNDFINYGEDFANQWFNIDLATDIFSWINQEFAVGVLTLDNSSSASANLAGLILLETDNRPQAETVITKLENISNGFPFIDINKRNIKGITTTTVTVKTFESPFLSYGWFLDNALMMTVGTDFQGANIPNNSKSLLDSENFKITTNSFPRNNLGYVYFDVEKILNFSDYLAQELEIDIPSETKAIANSIKGIAVTSSIINTETSQFDLFISLKKK